MSTPISSSSAAPVSGSAASGTITSTGIGSGLNIGAIVQSLTQAYGAAQNTQLSNRQNTLTAQLSAFGTFQSALDTLQATLGALETPSRLAGFSASVADKTVATAAADASAVAGSYSLSVQNLATPAILTSNPFASANAVVGTGTLVVSTGGRSSTLTIDSGNDTLSGIAAAINAAPDNPGVSASIITTTSGARLVLSGTTTGAANAVTVSQSGGDGGLASIAYDPAKGVTGLAQTQSAQDANFTLNGYPATSASNVVTGALTGVTLDLVGASAANTSTSLTVKPDTSAASTSIGTFVTALNGVIASIQSLTSYDPTSGAAGPLQGNATLLAFQNQLAGILDAIDAGAAGGATSLAAIGVSAGAQGTYTTDANALGNALSSNLTAVGNLLGGSKGIATRIDALIRSYTGPGGLLATIDQGLQTGLKNVAHDQSALNAQLAVYAQTLTKQYNAMDTAVARLKQMQTYLTAEFNPNQATGSSGGGSSLGSGNLSTGG